MSDILQFKLVQSRIPVVLEDAEGNKSEYELREMSALNRDRYLDRLSDRMRLDNNGKPAGLKKYEGLQADLLSNCLFDSKGNSIAAPQIQGWPSPVVTALFKKAQELNKLAEEDDKGKKDAEVKNV